MYIEELYGLMDELNLNKEELDKIKTIIRYAGCKYLLDISQNTLQNTLDFVLENYYIESTPLLNKLGIKVQPQSWKESHMNYDFQKTRFINETITKSHTIVIFPTELFKSSTKDELKQKIKTLSF